MFTGLVEEIGTVKSIQHGARSIRMSIGAKKIMDDVKMGDSISTNGICLTVTSFDSHGFTVDVMPETMRRSNLGSQKVGSRVNLERALRVGDRLGGHMVGGHIDGTGKVVALEREDNAIWVSIEVSESVLRYVIEKGSIAIDGISLTVASVDERMFKVSIIPLTQQETTLTSKRVGDIVNLECDMTAKYIEKFMLHREEEKKDQHNPLTMDFLKDNGFV